MQLVQQLQFKLSHVLNEITFLSKNLFNVATYTVRQQYFKNHQWIRYNKLWRLLKSHDAYKKLQESCGSYLPQQVLKQVDPNFKRYFEAIKVWKKRTPSKFRKRPNLPHYKRKNGENLVYFTSLQFRIKEGYVLLKRKMEKLGFSKIKINLTTIKEFASFPSGIDTLLN